MKYLALISYLGTDFYGFQAQNAETRTVQGALNRASEALFGCPCLITGCSRTDSGVHAERFCLTLEPTGENAPLIPPEALPKAILPYLPPDISLYFATEAPDGFHPRYDTAMKEYIYRMRFDCLPDPFLQHRVWQLPFRLAEGGFESMQRAAAALVGRHDFVGFMCTAGTVKSTIRTIYEAALTKEGNFITLSVKGDGFLYNMVRIIAGSLMEIGIGRKEYTVIEEALKEKRREAAGMTAPPDGLYLADVIYPERYQKLLPIVN